MVHPSAITHEAMGREAGSRAASLSQGQGRERDRPRAGNGAEGDALREHGGGAGVLRPRSKRWADTRIQGTTQRQVAAMFPEQLPPAVQVVFARQVGKPAPLLILIRTSWGQLVDTVRPQRVVNVAQLSPTGPCAEPRNLAQSRNLDETPNRGDCLIGRLNSKVALCHQPVR